MIVGIADLAAMFSRYLRQKYLHGYTVGGVYNNTTWELDRGFSGVNTANKQKVEACGVLHIVTPLPSLDKFSVCSPMVSQHT